MHVYIAPLLLRLESRCRIRRSPCGGQGQTWDPRTPLALGKRPPLDLRRFLVAAPAHMRHHGLSEPDLKKNLDEFCETFKVPESMRPQWGPNANELTFEIPSECSPQMLLQAVSDFHQNKRFSATQSDFSASAPQFERRLHSSFQSVNDISGKESVRLDLGTQTGSKKSATFFEVVTPDPSSQRQLVRIWKQGEAHFDDHDLECIKFALHTIHVDERAKARLMKGRPSRSLFHTSHHRFPFFSRHLRNGEHDEMMPFAQTLEAFFSQLDDMFMGDKQDGFHSQIQEAATPPTSEAYQAQLHRRKLESLGALIYLPSDDRDMGTDWSDLAGYDEAKKVIEETLLLTFQYPQVFEEVLKKTRASTHLVTQTNRPRTVLFHGPPGTGKTSSARIIASQIRKPLIYVPTESIVSKWFGESERNISKVFDSARDLGRAYGGCVIFIDEIDSLASSRDQQTMHEASRRLLSVLLRRLDGFDTQQDKIVLICATNRDQDLDQAFLSRVDLKIPFPLPNEEAREKIIQRYARHLTQKQLRQLAQTTSGFSGRNLRDLCQIAERTWIAQLIKSSDAVDEKMLKTMAPPPLECYLEAIKMKHGR